MMSKENLTNNRDLHIAWVSPPMERKGRLGLTILPGRRDRNRDLEKDLQTLKDQKVQKVIAIVTNYELKKLGVENLMEMYLSRGITARQVLVVDGSHASAKITRLINQDIDKSLKRGENVVVHCVGGLDRSGTQIATFLEDHGLEANDAIREVREARSPRAIETDKQRAFILRYQPQLALA